MIRNLHVIIFLLYMKRIRAQLKKDRALSLSGVNVRRCLLWVVCGRCLDIHCLLWPIPGLVSGHKVSHEGHWPVYRPCGLWWCCVGGESHDGGHNKELCCETWPQTLELFGTSLHSMRLGKKMLTVPSRDFTSSSYCLFYSSTGFQLVRSACTLVNEYFEELWAG